MKKTFLLALLVLLGVGSSYSQTRVTGTVTGSDDGKPVGYATVTIKGATTVATTDIEGKYSISVPSSNATLVFSFIGLQTKEVPVEGRSIVDVILEADAMLLEETVVIAYGVTKKSSFTGSAQVIKSDVIEKTQSANISTALQGAAAGVQVVHNTAQPGEAAQIRIRGVSSLNASSEPLWVVDGVPYDGLLNSLSQDDIESMTILKDAASASLYGARAANGVVLVTTKKGKKGAPVIDFKATWGVSSRAVKEYQKLNSPTHMEMEWEAYRNWAATQTSTYLGGLSPEAYASANLVNNRIKYNPIFVGGVAAPQPVGLDGKVIANSQVMWDEDWFDDLTQTPLRQDYQVSINGGADKVKYMMSLGYLNEQGVTIDSKFERYNARTSVETEIKSWLTTGVNLAISYGQQNFPIQTSSSFINPYIFSRVTASIYPLYRRNVDGSIMYDKNGDPVYDTGDWQSSSSMYRPVAPGSNPVAAMKYQTTKNTNWTIDPTWFVNVKFAPWLSFKSIVAVNQYTNDSDQSYSRLLGDAKGLGRIFKYRRSSLTVNANQVLSFSKVFADVHSVSAMVGHESTAKTYKYLVGQKTDTYDDNVPEWDMAVTMATMNSSTDELTREGYFGRISYDYDGKYFAEGSFRRDASSRFHPENRWGNFWSVSAAWRISREDFMSSLSFINDLKLRTSYGIQGNDALPSWFPYQGLGAAVPWTNSGSYSYVSKAGYYFSQIENNNLTWEKNASFNFGLDFGLFANRISGTIEYFYRTTSDMLFKLPLAPSAGFVGYNTNAGELVNQGLELDMRGVIVKKKAIEIGSSFNFTYLKSEITSLPFKEKVDGTKLWAVGNDPYAYYLYDYAGVNPDNGEALYWTNVLDANSKPTGERKTVNTTAGATKYIMGSALPKVTVALSPYFQGYGFDFSFMLTGQFGHKIYDAAYQSLMHDGYRSGYAWSADILNRWTPTNTDTDVPKVFGSGAATQSSVTSSRFLYNGDYLRFRSITLGYTLPKAWMDKAGIKKVRIFVQADNLWTIKLGDMPAGSDPEVLDGVQSYNSTASRILSGGLMITL